MDTNLALESVKLLPDQFLQAWEESRIIDFPQEYKQAESVVICGMGASGIPGHILASGFDFSAPTVLANSYRIPEWVNKKTLVILSSYSGNTEETLSCLNSAKEKKALITGITTGGKLAELLGQGNYPFYKYLPNNNPSGQPRMGIGYGILGQLGIFTKLGLIQVDSIWGENVRISIERVRRDIETIQEIAKEELAPRMRNRVPIVIAGEHLVGNARLFANQLNETAKYFSAYFGLPEANHHLLEGLKNPEVSIYAVFLNSNCYSKEVKRRLELTNDIVLENGHGVFVYTPNGDRLDEVLEYTLLSSFTSLALADLSGENPLAIPWVDYFKERLQ